MKFDKKNAFKLQISTYLEESLALVGKMMLEDIFDSIENMTEEDAAKLIESYYDNNVFDLIAPYLELASEEYANYIRTPEGKEAMLELKEMIETTNSLALKLDSVLPNNGNDGENEGNGNVH